jgi:hypothetical protein
VFIELAHTRIAIVVSDSSPQAVALAGLGRRCRCVGFRTIQDCPKACGPPRSRLSCGRPITRVRRFLVVTASWKEGPYST